MPMMYREFVIVLAAIVISRLIVLKSDQQFVFLLEGKLFKQDRDMTIAKAIYRKHASALSVIFFMIGGAGIGISVILLANSHRLFPLSAGATLVLLGLGIWGRLCSFRAANRDLDDAGKAIDVGEIDSEAKAK